VIDLDRHVALLRAGAEEDRTVARELVERGRVRHGLFFAHLALEKMLKVLVVRETADLPPRIHNLVRLAELALLELSSEHLDTLAELNPFNLAGRYPDAPGSPPDLAEAKALLLRAEEVGAWLQSRL
jgi:HEPN domain-containing protein